MAQVHMVGSDRPLSDNLSVAATESLENMDLDMLEAELIRLGTNEAAIACEATLHESSDDVLGSRSSNLVEELRTELQGQLGLFGDRLRRDLLAELPSRDDLRSEFQAAVGPLLGIPTAMAGAGPRTMAAGAGAEDWGLAFPGMSHALNEGADVGAVASAFPGHLADVDDLSQTLERKRAVGLMEMRERRRMGNSSTDWHKVESSFVPDEQTGESSATPPSDPRSDVPHVPVDPEDGDDLPDEATEAADKRFMKLASVLPDVITQGLAERQRVQVTAVVAAKRDAVEATRRSTTIGRATDFFGNLFRKRSARARSETRTTAMMEEEETPDAETESTTSAGRGDQVARRRRLAPPMPLFGQDTMREARDGGHTLVPRFAVRGQHKDLKEFHERRQGGCRATAQMLVGHEFFDFATTFVITLNAVSIGVQTDYMAASNSDIVPFYMRISDTIFCIIFTAELILRIGAHGRRFFFQDGYLWNWFDVAMVVLQLAEELTTSIVVVQSGEDSSQVGDLSLLRMLRIVRILRVLRLVRVVRLVRQLRVLVCSICSALNFLAWTVLLIAIQMYLVGVYFTQTVSDWKRSNPDRDLADLSHFFGSLPRSVLSLFQAITGGADWDTIAHPLLTTVSPLAGVVFVFYITFATLALLNVVTGVFVESALQSNASDRESSMIRRLTEIFSACDKDGNGMLTVSEMKEMLCDESVELAFQALDLSIDEVHSMLMLLDYDAKGTVDSHQFVLGCLRLRGAAKAVDITTLMFEVKRGLMKLHQDNAELLRLQAGCASFAVQRAANAALCQKSASLAAPVHKEMWAAGAKEAGGASTCVPTATRQEPEQFRL